MKEERVMVDRRKSQWRKFAGYGLTAFLVIAAAILLVFIFVNYEGFQKIVGAVRTALAPVIIGGVMAYLMNPLMMFFEGRFKPVFYRHARRMSRADRTARVLSIIVTIIVVFFLIGLLIYLIVPQLTETINGIIDNMDGQVEKVTDWYIGLELEKTWAGEYIDSAFQQATLFVNDFVDNKLISTATDVLGSVAAGVKSFVGTMYNILVGLIFSIYILGYKEKLAALSKKILYAVFKRRKSNTILRITRACHAKFIGSITGKIVDSALVGLLCFVAMSIFGIPYAILVSVIVGVTNVIPFFGPIIGAVPSGILILFASPIDCLYFLILIVVLQQLDANVLTPKIVGDSIGLSPFWVLFACTVFGSLWGVLGLLVGVPLMACIYMIVKELVEGRLHRKGLAVETDFYQTLEYVDETEMFCKVVDDELENAHDVSNGNAPAADKDDADSPKENKTENNEVIQQEGNTNE